MSESATTPAIASAPPDTSAPVSVTFTRQPPTLAELSARRLRLFRQQEQAVQAFYQQLSQRYVGDHGNRVPLFYVTAHCAQFAEWGTFQTLRHLDVRGIADTDALQTLFDHLHIVDDLLLQVVRRLPPQRPLGWQITSHAPNALNVPTSAPVRQLPRRGIEQSAAATVLQFLGVACFSQDKTYFIGHVAGYLFCCYYFAHLGVHYAATALKEPIANDYPYQWVEVAELVRLLQAFDPLLKAQVYQLAVYCAQISEYAVSKQIEKLLIGEVNSFDKLPLRHALAEQVQYDQTLIEPLFTPLKSMR